MKIDGSPLVGWRGYLIWAAGAILLLFDVIDSTTFGLISAGVSVHKGLEGHARITRDKRDPQTPPPMQTREIFQRGNEP